MGPASFLLLLTAAAPQDSARAFSDEATRSLITRAMVRHRAQDSLVRDYQARIRYRLTVSLGRRKWAQPPVAAVEEQDGKVAWERPNNLRVDIEGSRSAARNPDWRMESAFDSPWFVPRGLGDSVRVFGNDFPEQAAIHPLSASGPDYYRFEGGDTLTIRAADGRAIRLVAVQVIPRRQAASMVTGRLWIDTGDADVVRFSFRYVGTALWVTPDGTTAKDSADARTANKWANRILTVDADLEYGLQEGKYWMPYRQVLAGRIQIPLVSDIVIPFQATTIFDDYTINTGTPVVFHLPAPDSTRPTREQREARMDTLARERSRRWPDSLRARERTGTWSGGRFEIRRAPRDSLRTYAGWEDSLSLDATAEDARRVRETTAELAHLAEGLPDELTGVQRQGFAFERLGDVFRYNRVQGLSLGAGYQFKLRSPEFSSIYGTGRYGLTDGRFLARLAYIRDAPEGRLVVGGYRDMMDVDPFSRGTTLAASFRSLFFARDEADYYEAYGGMATWERSIGTGLDLTLSARMEDQHSVATQASAGFNDLIGGSGIFPPNPPITEGWFGGAGARLDGYTARGRWWVAADGLAGEGTVTGRLYGHASGIWGRRPSFGLRVSSGLTTADPLPQMAFRSGGQASVRGFVYGTQRGQAFWAVQSDLTMGRGWLRPVVFGDLGQAGALSALDNTRLMASAGIGASIAGGLLRLDLSYPLTDEVPVVRFDIVFGRLRW